MQNRTKTDDIGTDRELDVGVDTKQTDESAQKQHGSNSNADASVPEKDAQITAESKSVSTIAAFFQRRERTGKDSTRSGSENTPANVVGTEEVAPSHAPPAEVLAAALVEENAKANMLVAQIIPKQQKLSKPSQTAGTRAADPTRVSLPSVIDYSNLQEALSSWESLRLTVDWETEVEQAKLNVHFQEYLTHLKSSTKYDKTKDCDASDTVALHELAAAFGSADFDPAQEVFDFCSWLNGNKPTEQHDEFNTAKETHAGTVPLEATQLELTPLADEAAVPSTPEYGQHAKGVAYTP